MVITRSAPPATTLWTGAAAASMAGVPRRIRGRSRAAPVVSAIQPCALCTVDAAADPPLGHLPPGPLRGLH